MTRPKGHFIGFRASEHLTNAVDKFVEEEGIKNRSELLRMIVIFFFMSKMTGYIKNGDICSIEEKFDEMFMSKQSNQDASVS